MLIKPRKNEVDAVTRLLSSDEFDSPQEMSVAVVKAVMTELARRETFAVAHVDRPYQFFWPFFYEGDARKFHERIDALPGTKAYVLPMRSPLGDLELQAKHDAEAKERTAHLNWPTSEQRLT